MLPTALVAAKRVNILERMKRESVSGLFSWSVLICEKAALAE